MKKELVSKKIIELRRQNGLSQEQLSTNSGVALRTVQRIEAGAVSAHLQTLSLLAKVLNVEVSELTTSRVPVGNESKKNWLLFLHLSPVIGSALPLGNVLLPVALWLYKRSESESTELNSHGRSIVNFQLTMLMACLTCLVMRIMHTWSYAIHLFFVLILFNIFLILINSWRVWKGKTYYYLLSFPFLNTTKGNYAER
jgi:D-alanyl-D-alanine-carboxypeptidase/D-alanyl-D-alanine-endopeptidase